MFSTALYHSLIKPCLAPDESPFWPSDGPFVFDLSTMWDIYRTQLPLITALMPEKAVELGTALLTICEEEGNFPIGYRMARGSDRFSRQGSALAQTFLADLCQLGLPGIDWEWALVHMHNDLRRTYGEDFLLRGIAHPISHTLDLAYGYWCTAKVAAARRRPRPRRPVHDARRPLGQRVRRRHGPAARLHLLRGRPVQLLVPAAARHAQPHRARRRRRRLRRACSTRSSASAPSRCASRASGPASRSSPNGYALGRFEGLNNEPDMEAPWAYQYAGRPDRTAEVVHAAVHQQFGTGRGGLPGNDDSGGLSSWYVWASLGLFPVAGQNLFLVNAPVVRASPRSASARATCAIETTGFVEPRADGPAQYVQSVALNGDRLDRTWLRGDEVHRGGRLLVELGPEPSDWGRNARPPSASADCTPPVDRPHQTAD